MEEPLIKERAARNILDKMFEDAISLGRKLGIFGGQSRTLTNGKTIKVVNGVDN